jgi:hypothetical protein
MPTATAKIFQDLATDYQAGQTLESQLARPAHRLGAPACPGNRLSQPPQLVVCLHRLLPRTTRQHATANPGALTRRNRTYLAGW